MTPEHERLREAAGHANYWRNTGALAEMRSRNAFVEACTPAAVLSILADLQAANALLQEAAEVLNFFVSFPGFGRQQFQLYITLTKINDHLGSAP